jgi:hypothetical protein
MDHGKRDFGCTLGLGVSMVAPRLCRTLANDIGQESWLRVVGGPSDRSALPAAAFRGKEYAHARRIVPMLMVLLIGGAIPAHAGHRYPRHGGLVIVPRLVVPVVPSWWPYGYPPMVVAPAPPVDVQPAPPVSVQPPPPRPSWYSCEHPKGYYPYVQQCPGGWRQVDPSPAP